MHAGCPRKPFSDDAVARRTNRQLISGLRLAIAVFLAWGIATASLAQRIEEAEGLRLLQTEPFDILEFTEASGGGRVKVALLPLPGRKWPDPKPSGRLEVTVVDRPGIKYECNWSDVAAIRFWEEILIAEARALTAAGKYDAAFPYVARLMADFPLTPGLAELRRDFLLRDAAAALETGKLERALSIYEELRRSSDSALSRDVLEKISRVLDSLLQRLIDEQRLRDAQELFSRVVRDYGTDALSVVDKWSGRFEALAKEQLTAAQQAQQRDDPVNARRLAFAALSIWPKLEEARELLRELDSSYPLALVGVLEPAGSLDPTRIEDRAARRAGRLVYPMLFELQGPGPEGGNYQFLFGRAEASDDRQKLYLDFSAESLPEELSELGPAAVADVLRARATPGSPLFDSGWASILKSLQLARAGELVAEFHRPHVVPQGLLQVRVDERWAGLASANGSNTYRRLESPLDQQRFTGLPERMRDPRQPREVIEIAMPDAPTAIQALLRGDVSALDHVLPGEAVQLAQRQNIRVEYYPMPLVHMLVPVSDNPYLANRLFRRALIYGIDRQNIVAGELLGGRTVAGCEVVSGPLPAGRSANDPLAYGYDRTILPQAYQPGLAKLLLKMAERQLNDEAIRAEETAATLEPLTLAHPGQDIARISCEAIKQQLAMIGITVVLEELPAGQAWPADDTVDLVYAAVAMWEPAIDLARVIGPEGLAGSQDQLLGQGLRRLQAARNWREVRGAMFELHRTAHNELPVIPLYQLTDAYAYRTDLLDGVGKDNVSLYQQVDQWRVMSLSP